MLLVRFRHIGLTGGHSLLASGGDAFALAGWSTWLDSDQRGLSSRAYKARAIGRYATGANKKQVHSKIYNFTNRPSSYIICLSLLLTYTHGRLSNEWSVHASPMVYYEYRLAALAFDYRALDRYQENFTELQHKNNLILLSVKALPLFPYGYFHFAYCYRALPPIKGNAYFENLVVANQ